MSNPANHVGARGSRPGTLTRLVKMLFSAFETTMQDGVEAHE